MTKNSNTPNNPSEQQAIELRQTGLSIAKIMEATGLPERRVKDLTRSVEKPRKTPNSTTRITTPFAKSVERAFILARRKEGIRDYELKDILHEEYSSTWDTSKGFYKSNYTHDTKARVKAKVRKLAIEENCKVLFIVDWIDLKAPRVSSGFLMSAASDLSSRVNEYVTEYMAIHAAPRTKDDEIDLLVQRKQRFAVQRHLLKLAIDGYGPEPVEILLERTSKLVAELEADPDLEVSAKDYQEVKLQIHKADYYPEPSKRDHFLDYVEAQGWV